MTNPSGYRDPTAEQAVANVSRKQKATRYLPKDLHKALRVAREVFDLMGYEATEIRARDRDGNNYLWGRDS